MHDSPWVMCDPSWPPCERRGASCDATFTGLEVFVASAIVTELYRENVTYACLPDAGAMLADAAGPCTCDAYVGSLHPTGGVEDGIVAFGVPYFVGALYYVFPRADAAPPVTGFEFLEPFSWSLWVAFFVAVFAVPLASAILEKDPKESWHRGYLTFLADSWHAFWAVSTIDRDGASALLEKLGIAVALFARVLMIVYSANITSYVLYKTTDRVIVPSFSVAYTASENVRLASRILGDGAVRAAERSDMVPGGSLASEVLIVDELALSSYVDCSRAYVPFAESVVPYSAAFPLVPKEKTIFSIPRTVISAVSTMGEMQYFEAPPYSTASCEKRAVSSVRVSSVQYIFAAYAATCAISIVAKFAAQTLRTHFPCFRRAA